MVYLVYCLKDVDADTVFMLLYTLEHRIVYTPTTTLTYLLSEQQLVVQ